jgi:UDP-N-acetylmuramyl-tripeptide synthetase
VRLHDLLRAAGIAAPPMADTDVGVGGLCTDSRAMARGDVFIAIRGERTDGHRFVADAAERGAAAVVVEAEVQTSVPAIRVPDTRRALADLAIAFHGDPARDLCIVGITGTNGKTTTAYLVESILAHAALRVGVIGTVSCRYGDQVVQSTMTTPEAHELQAMLARMRAAGITHVVVEVSSHAVAQHRIGGLWLDAAVFTNLTQDHLDFHGDMSSYWQCKRRLFTDHLARGPKADRAVAVINCDHSHGQELATALEGRRVITVGRAASNHVSALSSRIDPLGIHAELETPSGRLPLESSLTGSHNLENILCAVGAGLALHIAPKHIAGGIAALTAVPGRLERVADPDGRFLFVDFAHSPDALEHVLTTLRGVTPARLLVVFGCGGDRDRGKRPQMGRIAARLCDTVVVTSDNPRSETPLAIIDEILPGVQREMARRFRSEEVSAAARERGFLVEPDRRRAIALALAATRPGDALLVAGKGHETYQILGRQVLPFDDRQELRQALLALRSPTSRQAEP